MVMIATRHFYKRLLQRLEGTRLVRPFVRRAIAECRVIGSRPFNVGDRRIVSGRKSELMCMIAGHRRNLPVLGAAVGSLFRRLVRFASCDINVR